MDYKNSKKKHSQPSKFMAVIAFFIALALPIVLVKTFRDQPPKNNTPIVVASSFETDEQTDILPAEEEFTSQESDATLDMESSDAEIITKPLPSPTITKYKTESVKKNNDWQIVMTKDGDTLATIFQQLGISQKTLVEVLQNNPHKNSIVNLKPGQKLQFSIQNNQLEKMIMPFTPTQSINISKTENGYKTQLSARDVSSHNHYVTATVKGSLYATAKRMKISYKLIQQMADIFNWEIDFSRDVRDGDQFTVVYKAFFLENKQVGTGEIIAVTYTTQRGKTYQAIRHTNEKGESGYFNENGESLNKAFSRYPLKYSHISSMFNLNRMHPVLKKRRPHKGVDLAASLGTPIKSVGDGRITFIGRNSGYGNMVKIKHNKSYSTLYAHMLRFKKGLSKGSRVRRGDVIGYVGQTGLATGPHCHFELHKNKRPTNPSTAELPRASSVPSKELATFKYNSGALLAHMKLYEEAHIAASQSITA